MKKNIIFIFISIIFICFTIYTFYLVDSSKTKNKNLKKDLKTMKEEIEKSKKENNSYEEEIEKLKSDNKDKLEELDIWLKAKEKLEKAL